MPQGRTTNLDPARHIIDVGGVRIGGYAAGSYITITQVADAFNDEAGSDGEVARVKSNDGRVDVTIKLLQTSASNDYLSGLHKADRAAPNGKGVVSFQMQDLDGTTIVSGAKAWIVRYPDGDEDRTPKSREWKLRIANGDRVVGGNYS